MADYIIDLRKDGAEFCDLANTYTKDSIVHLPNSHLSKRLKDQLCKVYKFMFGQEMQLEDDVYTFLLAYRDGGFNKIYYPCVVKGSADNSLAPDPTKLYIRWGEEFFELAYVEEKKGNKYVQSFFTIDGVEIDADIVSYPFNGAKYLDPALAVSFIDEDDDSYTINFPIKLNLAVLDPEGEATDYVASLKTAAKRGISKFLELVSEAKEYKAYAKTVNAGLLEVGTVYQVNGYILSQSSSGKDIVKLKLGTPHTDEAGVVYDEVWTPFELMNYIKSEPAISEDNPAFIVLTGLTTEVSKSNGREYTKPLLAMTSPGCTILENGAVVPGEKLSEDAMQIAYSETVERIVTPFRYQPTLSDRDLDVDVEYQVLSYLRRSSEGSTFYKLDVKDPRDNKVLNVWCPNRLIPTLTRRFPMQEGEFKTKIETPCVFKVCYKNVKQDKVYAHSILDFGNGVNPDSDAINLSFLS